MALQPSDRPEFLRALKRLYSLYRVELSDDVVDLWWEILVDYDLPAITMGLTRHVRNPDTGQFLPKPAEIIKHIGGTTQDAAQIAWSKVLGAIRKVGSWMDVAFDDPLIHSVLGDMGGWVLLCSTLEEEMPFRAREFENRYRGYARQQSIPTRVPRLTGRINTDNAAKGLTEALEPPMLVGDADKCLQVLGLSDRAGGTPIVQADKLLASVIPIKRLQ